MATMDLDQSVAGEEARDRPLERLGVGPLAQLRGQGAEQVAAVEVTVVVLQLGQRRVDLLGPDRPRPDYRR